MYLVTHLRLLQHELPKIKKIILVKCWLQICFANDTKGNNKWQAQGRATSNKHEKNLWQKFHHQCFVINVNGEQVHGPKDTWLPRASKVYKNLTWNINIHYFSTRTLLFKNFIVYIECMICSHVLAILISTKYSHTFRLDVPFSHLSCAKFISCEDLHDVCMPGLKVWKRASPFIVANVTGLTFHPSFVTSIFPGSCKVSRDEMAALLNRWLFPIDFNSWSRCNDAKYFWCLGICCKHVIKNSVTQSVSYLRSPWNAVWFEPYWYNSDRHKVSLTFNFDRGLRRYRPLRNIVCSTSIYPSITFSYSFPERFSCCYDILWIAFGPGDLGAWRPSCFAI